MAKMWPPTLEVLQINCSGEVFTVPRETMCRPSVDGRSHPFESSSFCVLLVYVFVVICFFFRSMVCFWVALTTLLPRVCSAATFVGTKRGLCTKHIHLQNLSLVASFELQL